ncbi:hypothetical protein H1R20_g3431, partial [Candolleomyces eurysporus]
MTTLTDADGGTIAWFSGGSCGFKKGNRATYEAGYQCAVRVFQKIEQITKNDGAVKVDMLFKGFGQGREALKGALLSTEGERIRPLIASITDRTPIKIGGTRAKKMPRNYDAVGASKQFPAQGSLIEAYPLLAAMSSARAQALIEAMKANRTVNLAAIGMCALLTMETCRYPGSKDASGYLLSMPIPVFYYPRSAKVGDPPNLAL